MNDRFLRALRRQPVDRPPVWIMRQAGRYLPEYREVRQRHDFLTVCRTPELAVEVTLQPLRRFPLDAAIVFSDILIPVEAMGCKIEFTPGPKLAEPIRTAEQIARLAVPDVSATVPFVGEAVARLRAELDGKTPVIGFCGAPFTLAAYLAQGQGKEGFNEIRKLMRRDTSAATGLLEVLADTMADYLDLQIRAGAQAVQIFDSHAGLLGAEDYRAFALPALQRLLGRMSMRDVPIIYFAPATGHLLEIETEIGADALGVCWRTPLDEAGRRVGPGFALQGNLEPTVLYAPRETIRKRVFDVLDRAGDLPGHVMNLGHGILPDTPIEGVEAMLEAVAERTRGLV